MMSAPMAYNARIIRRVDWGVSFGSMVMKYSLGLEASSLPSFSIIILGTKVSVESGWMLNAISLPHFNPMSSTHSLGRDMMNEPRPVHWTLLYPKSFSAKLFTVVNVSCRLHISLSYI